MSTKTNAWGSYKGLKRNLFKGDLHQLFMGEHMFSRDDTRRLADAYSRLFMLAIDIGQELMDNYLDPETRLVYSRNCSTNALYASIADFAHYDTAVIFKQFKCALQALRHLSDNDRPWYGKNYHGKNYMNRSLKHYVKTYDVDVSGPVWRFLQPYFSLLWYIDTPKIFRMVNDLVQYISRLTLADVEWIIEENIQEYVDFEEKLHAQTYDPDIVAELCDIVTDWFSDFDISDHWADHGYGATAEVKRSKGTAAKYRKMVPTVETALLANRLDWSPCNEIAWKGLSAGYERIIDRYLAGEDVLMARDLVCKVQLVPKGCDKKRVVSKEPTCHQFYQKMIGSAMSAHFDRHPRMKINLHDQGRNRRYAMMGSSRRQYATIDLSSASDSVTLTLFRGVFYKTSLYEPILWCRTTKAELPDGRVVALEKMSPMGSAVCFPIECTIFSAIVALANKRLGMHTDYCVYGDDLVVDGRIYDEVILLLKELHFLVNEDKSFVPEAPFKESCGIECYHGDDVSPIRLSRKFDCVAAISDSVILWNTDYFGKKRNKSAFEKNARTEGADDKVNLQLDSLYKHGNDAFYRGYMNLRRTYITDALELFKVPIFSHSEKYGFLTLARNICIPGAKEKFFSDSSRARKKGLHVRVLTTASTIDHGNEAARYSKLLEEYDRTSRKQLLLPDDRIECEAGAAHSYYQFEWVPFQLLDQYD